MSYDITLPKIDGTTPEMQLSQLNNYLFQLAQYLDFALNDIGGRGGEIVRTGEYGAKTSSTSTSQEDKPKELTFADVKALIIKSADIVNAYSEIIQKQLSKEYVAQSAYGEFVENALMNLEASADALKATLTDTQCILQPGGDGRVQTINIDGYIKAGKIDEVGGVPIIGVAIGQTTDINDEGTFTKVVQLTPERLAFFDSSDSENPVAWISDSMLYIARAQIVEHVTLGDYEIDTTDGIAFKWQGGGS